MAFQSQSTKLRAPTYVELLAQSNFTFLTGASHPEELVEHALQLGLGGLALADVHTVAGLVRGFERYKALQPPTPSLIQSPTPSEIQSPIQSAIPSATQSVVPTTMMSADRAGAQGVQGFRYIVGSLVDLESQGQFTLLAETREGFGKITQWLTELHQCTEREADWNTNGNGDGGNAAGDKGGKAAGGKAAGGKAAGGIVEGDGGVSRPLLLRFFDFWSQETTKGVVCVPRSFGAQYEKCRVWESLFDLFAGQCYLPMVRYLDGRDRERHAQVLSLAERFSLPIVASNDVYFHVRERKKLQDVLLSIRDTRPLEQMGYRLFPNAERCLKSPQEMERLFASHPQFLLKTFEVAERCRFQLSELRYYYPSEWIPQGFSAQQYLEKLVWAGANKRYSGLVPENVERQIHHELDLISQMHFADYFLTIYDVVEFARSQKILCQGRGSAANSVVCYVLGITAIDPVKMNLLFERFISVERGEPPDIDVDFEHERREEVIQYIYRKYGRHRAAMVCTHVCFRRRSALREVAKAFGVPVGTMSARQLEREWTTLVPDPVLREKIEGICEEVRGFPRHASIHTGGFTLSADPITRIVPVVPARMDGRTVIQWDKNDLETLGLLKVDILALGMLSALRKTLDAVGMSLYDVPHEDPATYQMLHRADTVGTFQVESRAQMSMLGRLQPKTFYDLVIQVAIVRPGPIVGRMVHPYLRRRRGWEPITYPHPKLEKILGRTLGVPLFQEQVMKLAIELAGFSPGEADQLRRAIGAWRSSGPLEGIGQRLREGLNKSGLPPAWIEQVFEHIKGFSEYGFPESHSASFALLAYASCYLKRHHPAEFLCALINSQPMGFYRVDSLIYDGLRHGIKILPIHLRHSRWECYLDETKALRLGFCLVRGLSRKEYQRLNEERERAPFTGVKDFLLRTQWRESILRRLVLAGRLGDPRSVLWSLLAYTTEDTATPQQRSLFEWEGDASSESSDSVSNSLAPEVTPLLGTELQQPAGTELQNSSSRASSLNVESSRSWDALDSWDALSHEYEAFGYSAHGHPMQILRKQVRLPKWNAQLIRQAPSGTMVEVSGMVLIRQKPPTAGGVVFATLEDEKGFIDLCLPPEIYTKYREVFLTACFLWVSGQTQRDLNTISVKVERLKSITLARDAVDEPGG
jgi:error-prone DNA polymerase